MTSRPPIVSDSPPACVNCEGVNRRHFLNTASVLSLGAILAACGDGVFDGPEMFLDTVREPIRVRLQDYPTLQLVGGRAVITPPGRSPMLVEVTGLQKYRAFSLTCPHKGTVVQPTADGFLCPNHGARFSKDGQWTGGQSTVDLTPIAVVVESASSLLVGGIVLPPPPPVMALSQSTAAFSVAVSGGNPAPQTIAITNAGGSTLTGLNLSFTYANNQPTGWLAASLSTLSAPSTLTLSVARGSLGAGTYTASVKVSSASASNGEQLLTVTLVVIDTGTPPAIQVSSSAVTMSATVGSSPSAQSVQIINSGSGTIGALTATIAYGTGTPGWLSTSSLSSTSTPSTYTVRPVAAALPAGTYTATISISGAGVPTRTVSVSMTLAQGGLAVTIANWPALANIGGVAGSVGTLNFSPIAIVRTGPNSFTAFSMICPHAGSYINVVNGQSFRCPNHGALFNGNGSLMAGSPIQTGSLQTRSVSYVAGEPVLYVN